MKKSVLTMMLGAAVAVSAAASSPGLQSAFAALSIGEAVHAGGRAEGGNAPGQVDEAIVNAGWTNIGRGMWYEDLMCVYEDFAEATGTNWAVDIEQSDSLPGYYRLLPYHEGTLIAELNWEADWNYIYIDATDPTRVVAKDFAPYDYFLMSHTVPENGWPEDAVVGYGTLADNVISFPPQAFSAYVDLFGEWARTSLGDGVRIALPGAEITDYSIHYSLDFCQTSSDVEFTLSYGASAAKAVGGVFRGYFQGSDDNLAFIAQSGAELSAGDHAYRLDDGMYTFFVVLLDAEGGIAASKVSNFFVYNDDKSAWEYIGKTDYSDDIYGSAYESVMPFTQSHQVMVEQNLDNPSLYRLKNPYYTDWEYYTRFNLHLDRHYHTHYIVVDASDPDRVVMRSSNLGVNVTFAGYGIVESLPTFNVSQGQPAGELYGTLRDGVISFPENSLVFYEHCDARAYVVNRHGGMSFRLPGTSSLDLPASGDDPEGCVYYDLMGREVVHPVKGSLYIERRGTSTRKVVY